MKAQGGQKKSRVSCENDTSRNVRPRLECTDAAIDLPAGMLAPNCEATRQYEETVRSQALCPICHNVIKSCAAVVPCGHTFCSECIDPWVRQHKTCPTCRAKLGKCPTVLIRLVDDLVAPFCKSDSDDSVREQSVDDDNGVCASCRSSVATAECGNCSSSLRLCKSCAEIEAWTCDECEWYFCGDCAARSCKYCRYPHVCWLCRESSLRNCPRPEC